MPMTVDEFRAALEADPAPRSGVLAKAAMDMLAYAIGENAVLVTATYAAMLLGATEALGLGAADVLRVVGELTDAEAAAE